MDRQHQSRRRQSVAQHLGLSTVLCVATLPVIALHAQDVDPAIASRQGYRLHDGSLQIVTARPVAGITRALDEVYLQTRPAAHITLREGDNYAAMAALTFDRTLVAPLGCAYTRIGLGDNLKIAAEPIGFRVAHATLTPGPAVPALGIIVNKANPIAALSLAQLARIFTTGAAGGDIAQWSQAGVKGPPGARAVRPVGPLQSDERGSDDPQAGEFLSTEKFGGLNMNHTYEALPHYADVVRRVSEDPAAIGIVALNIPLGDVKVLPLRWNESSAAAAPTADNIRAGRYPLDRFVYLYVRVPKGGSPDAEAMAYAQAALSEQGQKAIAAEPSGYITLAPGEMAEERGKLER